MAKKKNPSTAEGGPPPFDKGGWFEGLPEIDWLTAEKTLCGQVLGAQLEYRTAFPEFDWVMPTRPAWELRCSGCGEHWLMEKQRGFAVSRLQNCPRCHRTVAARRWKKTRDSVQNILVKFILRGEGRDVWIRCWRLSLMIGGDDGAAIAGYEKARFLFQDGTARKWQSKYDWSIGDFTWSESRKVSEERWNTHPHSWAEYAPAVYLDRYVLLDAEEADFSGTCIEYSAFTDMLRWSSMLDWNTGDIEGYLALYCKHPNVEYLVKAGATGWLDEYLSGRCREDFHKLVNLRAKKPKRLVKGLDFKEVQLLKDAPIQMALFYRELRDSGTFRKGEACALPYTKAIFSAKGAYERVQRVTAADPLAIRRYLQRQERKSGQSIFTIVRDWDDHLRDCMEGLGLAPGAFEMFPDDLENTHARLQRRLRRKAKTEFAPQFKHLRRRLRPAAWESGGLFIRAARSPVDVVQEGERQHNCVAGYQQKHAEKTTYIFMLRDKLYPDVSLYTVEWNAHSNEVIQCRGKGNRKLDDATEARKDAFMQAWIERNARLIREGKLKDVI